MYVVKVCCGFDEPSITRPLRDIEQALRWIAAQAWQEFDGDAERAEIFELDEMNPQAALREVRAGSASATACQGGRRSRGRVAQPGTGKAEAEDAFPEDRPQELNSCDEMDGPGM